MHIFLSLFLLALPASLDQKDQDRLKLMSPNTLEKIEDSKQLDLYDIKVMTRLGVTDEGIIDAINSTGSVFYLERADIDSLRHAGVSQKVIEKMDDTGH